MTDNYKRTTQQPTLVANTGYIRWSSGGSNTINFAPSSMVATHAPLVQPTPIGNITGNVSVYPPLDYSLPNVLNKRLPPLDVLKNEASHNTIQFELPAGHLIYYKYKSDANSLNRPSRSYFKRFITTSSWVFNISQISLVDSFIDEIAKEFKLKVRPLLVQVDPASFSGVELIMIPPYHYMANKFKNPISIAPNKNQTP